MNHRLQIILLIAFALPLGYCLNSADVMMSRRGRGASKGRQHGPQLVFENLGTTDQDYRIPAVFQNGKGEVVVVADRRFSDRGMDIGAGRIDIERRVSSDNGRSWGQPETIVAGHGGEGFECAHGDAAVVCDRETGRVLMLCASGSVSYPDGGCALGRYWSEDGGRSFIGGEMPEPDALKGMNHFFSSGRICQSRAVKVGSYYRIYSGVVTKLGAWVFYSDDFGETWFPLGQPVAGGNESKVEELPDGTLLHSCRISNRNGRMFVTYTYSADFKTVAQSDTHLAEGVLAAGCNGELLFVPGRRGEGVMLQSIPRSDKRENVSIYYKSVRRNDDYHDPAFFGTWDGFVQVSDTTSAYSSMCLLRDGSVAFVWEENNRPRGYVESYDIMFARLVF